MMNGFRDENERKTIDEAVMTIAIGRKSHAQVEGNEEEFDAALNELCEKWFKEFEHKSEEEMAEFLLYKILERAVR